MEDIYKRYHLSDFIDSIKNMLFDKIDKLEINDSTDVSNLILELIADYTFKPLILKEPNPSAPLEKQEERIGAFGRPYICKVYHINVSIPFEGSRGLFNCKPSTCTLVYFDESLRFSNSSFLVTLVLDDLDPEKYFNAIGRIINDLNSNIPRINLEIEPWNNNLENLIKQQIKSRIGIIEKKFDFMEKIGLNVNSKSTDYLLPPTVTKKAIPTPVTESTKSIAKEKIPILQEEVYQDIKDVLYNVGKAIERKPSIYKDKHEEDLRDMFLLFLETRYESTTGVGEAFNRKGKTDILLKYAKDGSNLFVAECKFWKGQKKLLEAIDQLLGYLTHRDSKTALIFFVDQKELTSIVETIKTEITKHLNFSKYLKDSYEHSISYEFSLPDDSRKKIQIEVILFHFPEI